MRRFNIDNLVKSRHSREGGNPWDRNCLKRMDSRLRTPAYTLLGQASGMTAFKKAFYEAVNIIIIAMSLCLFLPSAYASENNNFQFKKQPELQQIKPKKPVKIKLRRSAKDEYAWELTGDDVDEILKTDKKLRKMLNPR